METIYLTYFTPKFIDELNTIVTELQSQLAKMFSNRQELANEVVFLFVENFKQNNLYSKYNIRMSDKLVKSIKQTLKYAIDTEMLIRHILQVLDEGELNENLCKSCSFN